MKQETRQLFSDEIRDNVATGFSIKPEELEDIGGFESFIYRFSKNGEKFILRISHSQRRSAGLIQAEADWINYLYDNGVPVAGAVRSPKGNLIETVKASDGSEFIGTVFRHAPGSHIPREQLNPDFYRYYGQVTGQMHRLSKEFKPGDTRRFHYTEETSEIAGFIPESHSVVRQKFQNLISDLQKLPTDKESYGLVHYDFHFGNFFYDNHKITIFDFDDCQYSWFANDIAIILFYAVPMSLRGKAKAEAAEEFFRPFMEGYLSENKLSEFWSGQIGRFLKLRELDMYGIIHRSFDVENLPGPWLQAFMKDRKKDIENEVPFIEMDFCY